MLRFAASDGRELYQTLRSSYELAKKYLPSIEKEPSYVSREIGPRLINPLINAAYPLVRFIMENKSIPRRHAKDLEMAARMAMTMKRTPTKPKAWLEKNGKRIEFLLSTQRFPEKEMGGLDLFQVGPFEVHNTVGAGERDLETIKDLLRKAHKKIETSGVPHARKALYGKVHLTGNLIGAHTMAFYHIGRDDISVKIPKRIDAEIVRYLIHEFGHRIWRKFLGETIKSSWTERHHSIGRGFPTFPKAGEPLGVPVKGINGIPTVFKVERDRRGRKFYINEHAYVSEKDLEAMLKVAQDYPTPYAATNEEEHFCEAFSLYCLGTLGADHEKAFESIIIRGEEFLRG